MKTERIWAVVDGVMLGLSIILLIGFMVIAGVAS